jgi:DNA-binding NtrC family response regulator
VARDFLDVAEVIAFPEPGLSRPAVLVVDDEILMRGVLVEILQDSGLRALPAASNAEAMDQLRGPGQIALVFSDTKTEAVDGFALARWIHQNRPDIAVILAGGCAGETRIAAERCGAQVLRKPCGFDLIVDRIRETITRRQANHN